MEVDQIEGVRQSSFKTKTNPQPTNVREEDDKMEEVENTSEDDDDNEGDTALKPIPVSLGNQTAKPSFAPLTPQEMNAGR